MESLPSDITYLRDVIIHFATLPPHALEDDPRCLNKFKKAVQARLSGLSRSDAHKLLINDGLQLEEWLAEHKPKSPDGADSQLLLELAPIEGFLLGLGMYCSKPEDLEAFLEPTPKHVDPFLIETANSYALPDGWKRSQSSVFAWKGGQLVVMGHHESEAEHLWRYKTRNILNPPQDQPPFIIPVETTLENPIFIDTRTGYAIVVTCVGAPGPWCLEYLLRGPDGWLDVRASTTGKFGKHVLPRAEIERLITHLTIRPNPAWRPLQ